MEQTRLILLEGLPGTGKSTNAYFLSMQLTGDGQSAQWIHEVARPHPCAVFGEANLTYAQYDSFVRAYPQAGPVLRRVAVRRKRTVGVDLLELEWNELDSLGMDAFQALRAYDGWGFPLDRYAEVALDKWSYFVDHVLQRENEVYLLDSSLFQYQIFTFLLKDAPYPEIERFVLRLIDIIQPLNPNLLYFYRESAQDTVDFLERIRGTPFLEQIWARDRDEPYYRDKPPGAEGQKRFLLDYAGIAGRLFAAVDCRKKSIEITRQDWQAYEQEMLSFLGAERRATPSVTAPKGVFRNDALGLQIESFADHIIDPNGSRRMISPKSDREFYVHCLPVVLRFYGQDQIEITGGQICERWTTTGTRFIRVGP